jgi:hypothetical protein
MVWNNCWSLGTVGLFVCCAPNWDRTYNIFIHFYTGGAGEDICRLGFLKGQYREMVFWLNPTHLALKVRLQKNFHVGPL